MIDCAKKIAMRTFAMVRLKGQELQIKTKTTKKKAVLFKRCKIKKMNNSCKTE